MFTITHIVTSVMDLKVIRKITIPGCLVKGEGIYEVCLGELLVDSAVGLNPPYHYLKFEIRSTKHETNSKS
jgi:hypothetical protein